jgi:hypothetical protein
MNPTETVAIDGIHHEPQRLNSQYRSKYIDSVPSPVSGGEIYFAPDKHLYFSSRYAVTGNFDVYSMSPIS